MRTSLEVKRSTLFLNFTNGRRDLCILAGQIPDSAHSQVFLGTWSLLDIFAHLIGWDETNQEAIQAVTAGRLPDFYQWIDKDWQTYNARLVGMYKKGTLPELITAALTSQARLIARLSSLPAGDLFRDFGVRRRGYKVTLARLIEAETGDEKIHLEQVKDFWQHCQQQDRSNT